jgi:hypothetical protein
MWINRFSSFFIQIGEDMYISTANSLFHYNTPSLNQANFAGRVKKSKTEKIPTVKQSRETKESTKKHNKSRQAWVACATDMESALTRQGKGLPTITKHPPKGGKHKGPDKRIIKNEYKIALRSALGLEEFEKLRKRHNATWPQKSGNPGSTGRSIKRGSKSPSPTPRDIETMRSRDQEQVGKVITDYSDRAARYYTEHFPDDWQNRIKSNLNR